MKKSSFILLLLFCNYFIKAQNTFSNLYSVSDATGWFFPDFESYAIDNDTIIGYGDAVVLNPDSTTSQGIFLYRIDSFGNEIDYQIYFDTLGEALVVDENWGNLIAPSVGGYTGLGATGTRNSFIFFKLNDDLSLEFRKEYPDTFNIRNFHHSITEVKNGYIIWGIVQKPDNRNQILIKYINYSGKIIWEEKIQRNISNVIIDFEKVNDSLFLIAIGHGDGMGKLVSYSIEEFDLNQRFKTKWTTPINSKAFYIRKIHKLSSGDILIHGAEEVEKIFRQILYRPILMRMDSDFEEKEKIIFGQRVNAVNADPDLHDFFNIHENIYGTGTSLHPITDINHGLGVGVLYNFNNDLDSLWSRNHMPEFPPGEGGYGNFHQMDTLSSGNLILAGAATERMTGKKYGWVMKTLRNGCLTNDNCDIDGGASDVNDREIDEKIILFPNPTQDNLTVFLPKNYKKATIQVFNLTGQMLYEAKAEDQYQFSTETLETGIYLLRVSEKQQGSKTLRFQVFR